MRLASSLPIHDFTSSDKLGGKLNGGSEPGSRWDCLSKSAIDGSGRSDGVGEPSGWVSRALTSAGSLSPGVDRGTMEGSTSEEFCVDDALRNDDGLRGGDGPRAVEGL